MNQPTGWGQPQGAWGQPAPAPPQAAPPQVQQPQFQPQMQQVLPQAPPGYPMQPPPGYPQQPAFQPPPGYPQQQAFQPPPGYPPPPQQPNFAMDPFAGLTSGDQTATRNPYLEDGDYMLKVVTIKAKPARSGKLLYIIETEILQSNNPSRPQGMHCASFIDMSNRDLAGRHIAAFTTAIHGYDPTKLPKDIPTAPWADAITGRPMKWEEYARYSIHDSNPWANRQVGCRVSTIQKQDGDDFSLHTWVPAAMMVVGPMRPMAVVAPPAAAVPQSPFGAPAPTGFGAPQQQSPFGAPQQQAPNWGNPAAQGWGPPNQGR